MIIIIIIINGKMKKKGAWGAGWPPPLAFTSPLD